MNDAENVDSPEERVFTDINLMFNSIISHISETGHGLLNSDIPPFICFATYDPFSPENEKAIFWKISLKDAASSSVNLGSLGESVIGKYIGLDKSRIALAVALHSAGMNIREKQSSNT